MSDDQPVVDASVPVVPAENNSPSIETMPTEPQEISDEAQPETPVVKMSENMEVESEVIATQTESQSAQPTPPPPVAITAPVMNLARDLAAKARAVIQGRKRVKLEKIIAELTKRGSITNDQVEKLLHVSDATATRYLSQLEKEGKIQQVGKTGKSVKYQKL